MSGKKALRHSNPPKAGYIPKASVKKLARRAGVKRVSGLLYEDIRAVANKFLKDVMDEAVVLTLHKKRKTIGTSDVVKTLKDKGRTLYGFGDT